jgi:glycogen(starch) synthase
MDVIISVSNFVRRRLVQILGENPPRYVTIYNGVDHEYFAPRVDSASAKRALGISGGYVVLFIGRLASNKGIGHLLGAMPSLKRGIRDVTLVIGGRGEMEGELKKQALKLGVSDVTDFRGFVSQDQLPVFYAASDVVVVPSTYEPGGIIPLEAMSMKKPIVGSRAGGILESVSDGYNGVLVPPADSESIASAVLRLHDDPGMAVRLGENGRETVLKRFTWGEVARQTLGAYSMALSNRQWG